MENFDLINQPYFFPFIAVSIGLFFAIRSAIKERKRVRIEIEQREVLQKELSAIKNSIARGSAIVNSQNIKIWEGFIGKDFKSYNDTWEMEHNQLFDEFLELHKNRYRKDAKTEFKFLFFIKDDYSAFERFIQFQSCVHFDMKIEDIENEKFKKILAEKIKNYLEKSKGMPETLKRLRVFLNKSTDIPNLTFFRGIKDNGLIALLYLSIKKNQVIPNTIFQINDKSNWDELDSIWDNDAENSIEIKGDKIFEYYLGESS